MRRLTSLLPVSLCLLLAACGSGIPDEPLPMNLEAETEVAKKNAQIEIDMIQADKTLSEEEKKKQVAAVHKGVEGYLRTYAESKKARDAEYGPD